jgi:hypothetical protein
MSTNSRKTEAGENEARSVSYLPEYEARSDRGVWSAVEYYYT